MRRNTGEECESFSTKAPDKPVSSGGKELTSSSWMAAHGLKKMKPQNLHPRLLKVLTREPSVSLVGKVVKEKDKEFVIIEERCERSSDTWTSLLRFV